MGLFFGPTGFFAPLVLIVGWIAIARWLIGPLLTQAELARWPTSFQVVDFLPLVFQLSMVGAIASWTANDQQSDPVLYVALVVVTIDALGCWWLAVRCLAAGRVTNGWKRLCFQMLVIPLAVFFPFMVVGIPYGLFQAALALEAGAELQQRAIASGVAIDFVVLWLVFGLSRWVTAGSAIARGREATAVAEGNA